MDAHSDPVKAVINEQNQVFNHMPGVGPSRLLDQGIDFMRNKELWLELFEMSGFTKVEDTYSIGEWMYHRDAPNGMPGQIHWFISQEISGSTLSMHLNSTKVFEIHHTEVEVLKMLATFLIFTVGVPLIVSEVS